MTVERQLSIATEGFRGGGTGAAFLLGKATLTGAGLVATTPAADVATLSAPDKAVLAGQTNVAKTSGSNTATLGGRLVAKKRCD